MSLVITDTSPVRALRSIELLDVLPRLFDEILVPPAVVRELAVDVRGQGAIDVEAFPFFHLATPLRPPIELKLPASLGAGESEAIALALERQADFILVDDAAARAAAGRLGLRPLGVLGVLVFAKADGLIDRLRPPLELLLTRTNFRISKAIVERTLAEAGE